MWWHESDRGESELYRFSCCREYGWGKELISRCGSIECCLDSISSPFIFSNTKIITTFSSLWYNHFTLASFIFLQSSILHLFLSSLTTSSSIILCGFWLIQACFFMGALEPSFTPSTHCQQSSVRRRGRSFRCNELWFARIYSNWWRFLFWLLGMYSPEPAFSPVTFDWIWRYDSGLFFWCGEGGSWEFTFSSYTSDSS